MLTNCEGCQKEFECDNRKYNYNTKNNINVYCGFECYSKDKKKKNSIITQCANCGKDICKQKSSLNKSKTGNLYCSKTCAVSNNNRLFKKWENHPKYKNGGTHYRSYKLRFTKEPKCERCGYDANISALDIHHKNRDRSDNRLDNLEVLCCNCHAIEHRLTSSD